MGEELNRKGQKPEGFCIRKGTVLVINDSVVTIFPKRKRSEKRSRLKSAAKEAVEGIALGLLFAGAVFGTVKIGAALPKPELPKEYIYYCEEAGQAYNICPELLMAIIETESGGDPDAVGEAGEIGLMQVYPAYHQGRALHLSVYNLFDPEGNVLVGADYLAELFSEYGDVGTVLMAYNGTADAEERGNRGEYTEYAEKIMERASELERLHEK